MPHSKFADQTVALVHIPAQELAAFEMVMETLEATVVAPDPSECPEYVITGYVTQEQYEQLLETWPDSQIVTRREINRYLLDEVTIDELLEAAKRSMP